MRVRRLYRPRELSIQLVILLSRTGPEHLAEVRLVPDLPVADVIVETFGPAAVVVQDHVPGYRRVLVEVLRRMRVGTLAAAVLVFLLGFVFADGGGDLFGWC